MTAEYNKGLESLLEEKMSRRDLFKRVGKVAAGVALATNGLNYAANPASAETVHATSKDTRDLHMLSLNADGNSPVESLDWLPESRDPLVRKIKTTTFSFDPNLLSDMKRNTVIGGISYNPYQEEFAGLDPSNPRDRLDRAFFDMSRRLHANSSDYADLPEGEIDSSGFELLSDNIMSQRAKNGELPPDGMPQDEFAQLLNTENPKIPIWTIDEETGKYRLKKFTVKQGININISNKKPQVALTVFKNPDNDYEYEPFNGYSLNVTKGKLNLDIYVSGTADYETYPYFNPGFNIDSTYSMNLVDAFWQTSIFGGRADVLETAVLDYGHMQQFPGYCPFPDQASLLNGTLSYRNYYEGSPVLYIVSPDVDRSTREYQA